MITHKNYTRYYKKEIANRIFSLDTRGHIDSGLNTTLFVEFIIKFIMSLYFGIYLQSAESEQIFYRAKHLGEYRLADDACRFSSLVKCFTIH